MSDPLARALLQHLVRRGDLDSDDIATIADGLEASGEPEAAHLCRVALIEALAPSQAEWEAERRRSRMRAVPSDGKAPG